MFAIFKPVLPNLGGVTVRQGGGPPGRGEAVKEENCEFEDIYWKLKDYNEDQLDDGEDDCEDDGETRILAVSSSRGGDYKLDKIFDSKKDD